MQHDEYMRIVRDAEEQDSKTLEAERTRARVIAEQLAQLWGTDDKQYWERFTNMATWIGNGLSWQDVKKILKENGEWQW